jgi:predicted metalloendopeptidase
LLFFSVINFSPVPSTVGVTNDATVNLILKEARQLLGGETVDASRITQFYAQFEDDDAHEDVDVNKLSEEVSSRGKFYDQADNVKNYIVS